MSNSPWGKIDYSRQLTRGVRTVGTAGHGGFMISEGAAKRLSPEARARGEQWSTYLCYEEDDLWNIVAFELEDVRKALGDKVSLEEILHTLSAWNADYLIERGIDPEPTGYKYYLKSQEDDKMRREENPDFIVAALAHSIADVCQNIPAGTVKVWTADDKIHYVKEGTYDACEGRLSKCVEVTL